MEFDINTLANQIIFEIQRHFNHRIPQFRLILYLVQYLTPKVQD